ncbi:YbdD/YjiX family protein [Arthrobacter polaris]|uniref:YbdD/YjiX family protein n=1 Tax=Arthrobacter polaris TaxID=2813727 RepID=UPI001F48BFDD|nr:YbdD/YjiX family protein [Arthrobacter polaris]UIK88894.1 YbdD/YjiX family protein [Arthrobacter polaris]
METLRRVAAILGAVNKYVTAVMGADAYERYLEHYRASRCEVPAMTVKEFWRDKNQRQDSNPEGRCC